MLLGIRKGTFMLFYLFQVLLISVSVTRQWPHLLSSLTSLFWHTQKGPIILTITSGRIQTGALCNSQLLLCLTIIPLLSSCQSLIVIRGFYSSHFIHWLPDWTTNRSHLFNTGAEIDSLWGRKLYSVRVGPAIQFSFPDQTSPQYNLFLPLCGTVPSTTFMRSVMKCRYLLPSESSEWLILTCLLNVIYFFWSL
jgi:hypothetical protein